MFTFLKTLISKEKPMSPFIQFINAQAPDRPINHSSWGSCAVGDYCDHVGIPKLTGESWLFPTAHFGEISGFHYYAWDSEPDAHIDLKLFRLLNSRSATRYVPTYGALQAWIKENS